MSSPLVDPGDSIVFTTSVTNAVRHKPEVLNVIDTVCPHAPYQGGETDGDSFLDHGETWTYQCTCRSSQKTCENRRF